ncbi:dihydroneopterin aldolase [Psychrobacter sanguinis]|uniref:dihydroneopterin aldolase n=1 Tax=Psychrobacter sanguinis TaxID=861445 RepID=UPI00020C9772|nr:dihydroneopterin aldolase [Psychrobacter sanguinis]EGK15455.1 dihydroneopterin aldolase [Psychrobacter sp. 1501(2011)]MCD9151543.1 dihydroneopterin aldolase [Psychrobacter sanguinis]
MNKPQGSTDFVKIKGLKVNAVIGVFDWERAIEQPLLIDVSMATDISEAGKSDDINDAINYKEVCDDITELCQQTKALLIERLAELIAAHILSKYNTTQVEVSVAKPTAIKAAEAVAVQITRTATTD